MTTTTRILSTLMIGAVLVLWPLPARAQDQPHFDVGAQFVSARSSELDSIDAGIGARIAWLPGGWIGLESELNLFPRALPKKISISTRRIEGLFGVSVGPAFDRVRPFAQIRSGFLRFGEAPGPIACIAIFPPPLTCTLAAGRTLLAVDSGGGVDLYPSKRVFVRVEAGDRAVKYPGPAFDRQRKIHSKDFFGHDLRFAAGAGWRF